MGVLLNKLLTGLNLIAHKLADHALGFSSIFDTYRSMVRVEGSMVVSHS